VKTHVLGWSFGGQVALKLAMRHAAQVDDMVLVATTPKFVSDDGWTHAVKPGVLSDFAARLSTNYAATIRNFLTLQALSRDKDKMRNTIQLLQKAVSARGAPNIENLMHGLKILAASDLREQLHLVTQRTLVIQGDQDTLTPEPAARWLATALPNVICAEYEMIPTAAHAPFLSHRMFFINRVKQFLQV
ncbi:MAG: alpha/beta fold hydrolase, partial [Pseudomonadota bacterium]